MRITLLSFKHQLSLKVDKQSPWHSHKHLTQHVDTNFSFIMRNTDHRQAEVNTWEIDFYQLPIITCSILYDCIVTPSNNLLNYAEKKNYCDYCWANRIKSLSVDNIFFFFSGVFSSFFITQECALSYFLLSMD